MDNVPTDRLCPRPDFPDLHGNGTFEIGIVQHDQQRLAAQFEKRGLEMVGAAARVVPPIDNGTSLASISTLHVYCYVTYQY